MFCFSGSRLFRALLKSIFVIALVSLIFVLVTNFVLPARKESKESKETTKYIAIASLLVTNAGIPEGLDETKVGNMDDITASINLIPTVIDILNDKDIYEQIKKELNDKYSAEELKKSAVIKQRDEYSLFIDVSFKLKDPDDALKAANSFLKLAPSYVKSVLPTAGIKTYPPSNSIKCIED